MKLLILIILLLSGVAYTINAHASDYKSALCKSKQAYNFKQTVKA